MPSSSRSQEDIKREERVYRFLLKLSDIKINPDKQNKPEIRDIASKWGFKNNRTGQKFVERVLSNLYDENEDKPALPSLSLSRLVEILEGIENYWNTEQTTEEKVKTGQKTSLMPKKLSKVDKIRAIRKYCELYREEKQKLNLPVDFKSYIQENFIDSDNNYPELSDRSANLSHQKYVDNYLNIDEDKTEQNLVVGTIQGDYFDNLVEEVIKEQLSEDYLKLSNSKKGKNTASKGQEKSDSEKLFRDWISDKNNQKIVTELKNKVRDEINVIAVKSGLEIVRHHIVKILQGQCNQAFEEAYQKQWESQLPDKLIKQLTANIIENSRISENNNITISFKYLELKKVGPLPFESEEDNELINDDLLKHDPDKRVTSEAFSIFRKNHAYQIRVYFRLRVNDEKIDFFEEVSGISSILSLIRKALNRALLWDIPCLSQYFPVMQEVFIEDKLFGGDSLATVLSKSRGRLVEIEDVKKLLENDEKKFNLDSYLKGLDIIESKYIGFDLVESIAISGFYDRLKLIEQTGIDPKIYLNQLKKRIEEKKALLEGKKYLRSYPFSLLAMKKHLEKEILVNYKHKTNEKWTRIAYRAKLSIIEGYLAEGLVKEAEKLLKELENHEQYFSHFLKASYYLCQAEYMFLCHEDEHRKTKQEIVKDCQDYLQKAENELRQRFLEFFRIGEIAQGNLSPLYHYWTKIYLMRGRLSLYFPRFLSKGSVSNLLPTLVYFGKARVYYAPRGGDSYLCGKVSLYQSWCYLMQGYIGGEAKGFDKKTCIDWAKKLIDHALRNYQGVTEECYRDYTNNLFSEGKDKYSGLSLTVQRPPFLNLIPSDKELTWDDPNSYKSESCQNRSEQNNNDDDDVKIFSINSKLIKCSLIKDSSKSIDIFGQHSSLYFFVLGMLKLCDDYDGKSDEKIKECFEEAYNYFVSSWAIAQGCSQLKKTKNGYELNRNCEYLTINNKRVADKKFNVSKLRSLYFHCISEWMDLGKIFMAVCKVILAEDSESEVANDIDTNDILSEVEEVFSKVPEDFIEAEFCDEQKFYNRHLQSQFKRIKDYLGNSKRDNKKQSLSQYRDEVVKNIFLRLRGD